MRKAIIVLFLLVIFIRTTSAQKDSTSRIYEVNRKYELTGSVLGVGLSFFGFKELDRVATMTESDVMKLNPNDLNSFDRPIAFKDPAGFANAQDKSDLFLNVSILSPALLMIDKKMRKDWLDLLTLYMVTHAIDNAVYFACAYPIRRPRPLTYNPALDIKDKTGLAKSNSFFSGHVSFSTTSTFFLAKVLTDYNHIKGLKRILIFTVAAIPPALVGYYRTEAGKHFKTDVITGFIVGAVSGILVPEWHKRMKKNDKISLRPFTGTDFSGLALNIRI